MIRSRDLANRQQLVRAAPRSRGAAAPRSLAAHPRPFLSPGELAGYWGVHVDTVYRAIDRGALPARRIGGQLRVAAHDAADYTEPDEL